MQEPKVGTYLGQRGHVAQEGSVEARVPNILPGCFLQVFVMKLFIQSKKLKEYYSKHCMLWLGHARNDTSAYLCVCALSPEPLMQTPGCFILRLWHGSTEITSIFQQNQAAVNIT